MWQSSQGEGGKYSHRGKWVRGRGRGRRSERGSGGDSPWVTGHRRPQQQRSSGGRCGGRRRPLGWSASRSSRGGPSWRRGWRTSRGSAGSAEQGLLGRGEKQTGRLSPPRTRIKDRETNDSESLFACGGKCLHAVIVTQCFHPRGLAQNGPEPRGGAGSGCGSIVAWCGGVGLQTRRGGFVILSGAEREN